MTIREILDRLDRVRQAGRGQWSACCPSHERDGRRHTPSLSIAEGREGRTVVYCHAGCTVEEIAAAAGLTMADLASSDGQAPDHLWTPHGTAILTYPYTDEQGRELFTVHRTADKQFPQSRPDPAAKHGRRWKLGNTRRVLYQLPRVQEAVKNGETIYVVEGEKDVHAIEDAGAVATCNPGGAGKWLHRHAVPPYRDTLAGANVVIIADRDRPGLDHARDIVADLGDTASVQVVQAREGKDVADHLAAGRSLADLPPIDWSGDDKPPPPEDPEHQPAASRIRLWTIDDLSSMTPPTWRILDVLPDNAFSLIFGKQSTYKSFVALAWCLSIAAGIPWLGRHVLSGHVVYIAAEGGPGILKRIRAWQITHPDANPVRRFRVVPHRVDLRSPADIDDLKKALHDQLDDAPALTVIDTWSRNTPGANENSAEDTSAAIAKLDEIREQFGSGVLVVHHAGHENNRERGSSALAGAADCRWETDGRPNESIITLRNHKQKDWSDSDPIPLRRHVVGEGEHASLVMMLNQLDPCNEHQRIIHALNRAGIITQRQLESLIGGMRQTDIRKLAKDTAECPRCPVVTWSGSNNAKLYARSDQNEIPL